MSEFCPSFLEWNAKQGPLPVIRGSLDPAEDLEFPRMEPLLWEGDQA